MTIVPLATPPEPFATFPHPERYEWYRLDDEDGPVAYAALAESGEAMEMHLEALRWGPQAKRTMNSGFQWVKEHARKQGKKRIIGLKAEHGTRPDPRWPKFVGLFGFGNNAIVQTATLEL